MTMKREGRVVWFAWFRFRGDPLMIVPGVLQGILQSLSSVLLWVLSQDVGDGFLNIDGSLWRRRKTGTEWNRLAVLMGPTEAFIISFFFFLCRWILRSKEEEDEQSS